MDTNAHEYPESESFAEEAPGSLFGGWFGYGPTKSVSFVSIRITIFEHAREPRRIDSHKKHEKFQVNAVLCVAPIGARTVAVEAQTLFCDFCGQSDRPLVAASPR